jgi:chromosome partitioning protein
MTLTIAITNQKGGTGKTTVSLLIAAAAAALGKRTAVVDLDPEGNASFALNLDLVGTTVDLLKRKNPHPTPTQHENLTAFTGGDALDDSQIRDISANGLRNRLADYHFDVVVCDCPPQQRSLQRMALTAASTVVIVADAHPLSIRGVDTTLRWIENERADGNLAHQKMCLVFNRVDGRRKLDGDVRRDVTHAFPNLQQFTLRQYSPIAQAMSSGSITDLTKAVRSFDDATPLLEWLTLSAQQGVHS